MTTSTGTARREFYSKRLAQKNEELAAIDAQLLGTLGKKDELKLNREAEQLLEEIEKLQGNLDKLDAQNKNSNVRYSNLEKSFQKIDNKPGKDIAKSVNNFFGEKSGAILLFLQRCTKQKGCYCLNEVLDLIIGERKIGDEVIGDFRPYEVDLGSPISEFNEFEFSQRLTSYFSHNSNETYETLNKSIKKICSSLQGGSTVFIKVENWDSVIEQEKFLNWFIKEFWEIVIGELEPIFQEYSKIRFIVALMSKSRIFSDCCSLEYFCSKDTFDYRKIIEIPLPDWNIEDIKTWLITFRGLSNRESLRLAREIYRESEGSPDTICSILEGRFNLC